MSTENAVQAAAAQKIAADPLLSKHVDVLIGERGPDGRLLSTHDSRLKFPEGNFFGDITTSSARAAKAHFKSYGDTLLLFPY